MTLRRKPVESQKYGEDIYETEYQSQKFTGTLRECLLFGMGFGCDQAAELRYEMARGKAKPLKK